MKLVWIVSIAFLSACTVTQPHIAEFVLSPKIVPKIYEAKKCQKQSIKVGQVFSANSMLTKKMKYIQSEYEESTFTQSQWARTPNRAISDELLKSIRSSGLFKDVSSFKSRAKTDLLLETHVENFMQYFLDENKSSYVEVVLNLNILEVKSGKSIAHTTVNIRVNSDSVDAKGGVIALNKALGEALLKTNEWLAGVCK